jgi:hypothetical protein
MIEFEFHWNIESFPADSEVGDLYPFEVHSARITAVFLENGKQLTRDEAIAALGKERILLEEDRMSFVRETEDESDDAYDREREYE